MNKQLTLIQDQKPIRVTVPVAPDVLDAFKKLAASQGVSVGKAMGDWLADTVDGVGYMTDLLQKARKAPHLAVRELHAYASGLTETTTELLEGLRKTTGSKVLREAVAGARIGGAATVQAPASDRVKSMLADARKTTSADPYPPLSNTGGKVPPKPPKPSKTARGKKS
jgi:hypothetical protein